MCDAKIEPWGTSLAERGRDSAAMLAERESGRSEGELRRKEGVSAKGRKK